MKTKNVLTMIFCITFFMLFTVGCTKTAPADTTPLNQVATEPVNNTVIIGSPEVIVSLDTFKKAYNEQNVSSLNELFDLSLKSEVKNFGIVKNAMLYDAINNLDIVSEDDTSLQGKYVTASINHDAKPTTFTFVKRNNTWYISDFQSGLSLMDAVVVKSPLQVLVMPNISTDGVFTLHLRDSGTKMNQTRIFRGTGNCQNFIQRSDNLGLINPGDDFDLIFYCEPKLSGKNFIAALTLAYVDVANNVLRETNITLNFYDR